MPDVAGDRKFNIPSFSVVLGERTLFNFARRLLTTLLWGTSLLLAVGSRAAVLAGLPRIAVARYGTCNPLSRGFCFTEKGEISVLGQGVGDMYPLIPEYLFYREGGNFCTGPGNRGHASSYPRITVL